MDIKKQLLKEHSKVNAMHISEYVGQDVERFGELMRLFFINEYIITQRAAYSVGISIDHYPNLITPYVELLIDNLYKEVHDAVKRNTVRVLQSIEIPKSHQGKLTEKCFEFLTSNKEPIAVKAFSMSILLNMTLLYPDLKNELKIVIEDLMEFGTPAITSRGRKILKRLNGV